MEREPAASSDPTGQTQDTSTKETRGKEVSYLHMRTFMSIRLLIAPFTYVLVWLALRNPPPATAVAGCWLVRRQMSITSTKVQPYLETCRLRQRMSDYA